MRMSYTLGLKIIASENVAKNILVAGGHTPDRKQKVGQEKTTSSL